MEENGREGKKRKEKGRKGRGKERGKKIINEKQKEIKQI